MLLCVVIIALLGVQMTSAQCVQDRFNVRNPYEIGQDEDGFDVTLWQRSGVNLIGALSGGGVAADGFLTLAAGQSVSSSAVGALATLEELEDDGDQHFVILVALAQTAVGTTPTDNCLITVGGGETSAGFCVARNGQLRFPNRFALKPSGAVGTAPIVAVRVRRFAQDGEIRLDFASNVGGTTTTFLDQDGDNFEIGSGLVINAPPVNATHVIAQVIVLEGSERAAGDASAFFADATAALNDFGQCRFQQWTTGTGFVVPGSSVGNLALTLTTTNFGPNDLDAATAEAQFLPPEAALISNFTAVTVTGAVFNATAFSGEATTGGALAINALPVLSSTTFTFTATVFNCSATALPLTNTAIIVDGLEAEIFIQRESTLELIEVDTRPFDLQGLPIAVGCGVPFSFTANVRNNGPSCVENLELTTQIETPAAAEDGSDAVIVDTSSGSLTADLLFPGQTRLDAPLAFSISALESAPNARNIPRNFVLVSPLDGGVNSAFVTEPISGAPEADEPLFGLTYDVTRYADLSISVDYEPSSVMAGSFANPSEPNLVATVTVSNGACIPVTDISVRVQVDLPEGAFYLSADGQQSGRVVDRVQIDELAIEGSTSFTFSFAVCANTLASNAGINLLASIESAGTNSAGNDGDVRENTERFNGDTEFGRRGISLIRRFDDSCTTNAAIALNADVSAVLTCDKPALVDGYDDKMAKITLCRVVVNNMGSSDVSLKVLINQQLPTGTHVARWATSTGQFVDGVWVLRAMSQLAIPSDFCMATVAEEATFEIDFISLKPGAIQLVARIDEAASAANMQGQRLGNALTIDV